jgi:hypothetical protein
MAQHIAATPAIWVFLLAGKNWGNDQKNCVKEPGLDWAPINLPTTLHIKLAAWQEKKR